MSDSPSPVVALASMLRARRVRNPHPIGDGIVDHSQLAAILETLRTTGVAGLSAERQRIAEYQADLAEIDPDTLSPTGALAYWLNLYNAGALDLAAETYEQNRASVLRTPGAFHRPSVTVAGERLSLDDIEHGKVRRFRDPRIHAALVCGSASCPTLRFEPYDGNRLEEQLETQMGDFLSGGGAIRRGSQLMLSRVFLWYGSDFVRSHRMPSLLPAGKAAVRRSLIPWLGDPDDAERIVYQPFDWALACSIR